MELPEGATLSDSEDKNELDLNDPHRALGNINLDDVEEFYAAPSQRTNKIKHIEESDSSKLKEKSHRKKKEQIPEQNLMTEEVNEKKDKKKHKRKKEIISENIVNHEKSITTDILDIDQKVKKSKKKSKDNDNKKNTEKSKKHKKSSKKSEYEETL